MTKKQFKITAFGESMLRFSVPQGELLALATQMDVAPAGAESNLLSALAQFGHRASWHSAVPDSPLGQLLLNQFRMRGIGLDEVILVKNGRLGTYFIEIGAAPRPTQVIYDRANSAVSELAPDQINWDSLLDTDLLHLTGITPALSSGCFQIVQSAIARAKAARIPISFDMNYRAKLWDSPTEATQTLLKLVEGVTLLFCPLSDAQRVFGFSGTPEQVGAAMLARTGAKHLILSIGADGVLGFGENTAVIHQPALKTQIIDPIGAGDALAAGVIHGWLNGSLAEGLKYGTAVAALALSQHGDMVVFTPAQLEKMLQSDSEEILR